MAVLAGLRVEICRRRRTQEAWKVAFLDALRSPNLRAMDGTMAKWPVPRKDPHPVLTSCPLICRISRGNVLDDGKVLLAGGCPLDQSNAQTDANGVINSAYSAKAWIYDPSSRSYSPTGDMLAARGFHHAVKLRDGRVLIAGGSVQWKDPWCVKKVNNEVVPWAESYPFA